MIENVTSGAGASNPIWIGVISEGLSKEIEVTLRKELKDEI